MVCWTTRLTPGATWWLNYQNLDKGHDTGVFCEKISIRKTRRIATWNVRGLPSPGKLDIVERKVESPKITLLGITETHMRGIAIWRDTIQFQTT